MSSRGIITEIEPRVPLSNQNTENRTPKFKTLGFAIVIIFGIGGLAAAGVGIGGLLQVGSLSNLGQLNSFIMMAIGGGGGISLLIIGIVGFLKTCSNNKIENSRSIASQRIEQEGSKEIQDSFVDFLKELETEIFTFYENHETTFDQDRIHGRMHVARAVIFCEAMGRYLQEKGIFVDFSYVRRTTGLHDAGRKGNGPDHWEKQSSALLRKHFISKGMSNKEARLKSSIIIKNKCDPKMLEFQIFQSADCLDIMRPCTGHNGKAGFNAAYLTFLKDALPESDDFQFRQQLIEEAWEFIQITESKKNSDTFKNNQGFMSGLFGIISDNPDKFKILSSVVPATYNYQ